MIINGLISLGERLNCLLTGRPTDRRKDETDKTDNTDHGPDGQTSTGRTRPHDDEKPLAGHGPLSIALAISTLTLYWAFIGVDHCIACIDCIDCIARIARTAVLLLTIA